MTKDFFEELSMKRLVSFLLVAMALVPSGTALAKKKADKASKPQKEPLEE